MGAPHGYIERLAELAASGAPFASVTLVDVVGSTPADVGSKMLVTAAGLDFGTVGGGRVEAKAIAEVQEMLASPMTPEQTTRLLEWNLQRDVGMTCGGVVKLFCELYNHNQWQVVIFGAGHVAAAVIHCLLPPPLPHHVHRFAARMARQAAGRTATAKDLHRRRVGRSRNAS